MASKPSKRASAPKKQPTRAAYISFNREEHAALLKVGFRERWLYGEAKWLANFKTGVVGTFRNTRLSYQDLADLVTAPGIQGRGMGSIDDKEASRILERLQLAGLVANISKRAGNGGLVFELPLSPIDRKAAPKSVGGSQATLPDQPLDTALFLPDGDIPPFDDFPISTGLSTASPLLLSVLALTESKNNTDEAHAASADVPASTRSTSALLGPADGVPSLKRMESPLRAPTALTPAQIRDALAGDWMWGELDSPTSDDLFEQWADRGLTADLLFQATTELGAAHGDETAPLSPSALLPVLSRLGITTGLPEIVGRRVGETRKRHRANVAIDGASVPLGGVRGHQAGGHRPHH